MRQTIEWWKTLSAKGKVYSLVLINIFISLLLSGNNTYEYSFIIIVTGSLVGLFVLYDLTIYITKNRRKKTTRKQIFIEYIGIIFVTGFTVWSYFLFIETSMDLMNNKSIAIKSKLVNYTRLNNNAGQTKICFHYAHVINEKGETKRLCAKDIPNHTKLKYMVNKDVVLIGRSSWAGIVIDDIKSLKL